MSSPQFIGGLGDSSLKVDRDLATGLAYSKRPVMAQDAKELDIVFHYPPELTQLLIQTIPLLCPAKRDVLLFFKGSGVADSVRADLEEQLRKDRHSINKYEIVRTVLDRLNAKGEPALRERREILRRVTEFEDFSTCWPDDQLKAKGLVAEISRSP